MRAIVHLLTSLCRQNASRISRELAEDLHFDLEDRSGQSGIIWPTKWWWIALLHDLQNLELHRSARGFDFDGVADVRLEERFAHRAVDRDVGDVAVGIGRPGFADDLDQGFAFVV